MRDFFKRVQVDEKTLRFFAECCICGRREYGHRLPVVCRKPHLTERLMKSQAGLLYQHSFNKSLALAVQSLAMSFNLCRSCGRWVCDDCFRVNDENDACVSCVIKIKEENGG